MDWNIRDFGRLTTSCVRSVCVCVVDIPRMQLFGFGGCILVWRGLLGGLEYVFLRA